MKIRTIIFYFKPCRQKERQTDIKAREREFLGGSWSNGP